MTRADLRAALAHPNVSAFLAVIDLGEHGPAADSPDRYRTMYGGVTFDDYADHPRRPQTAAGITSTAAGRGQFLAKTWDGLVRLYHFPDFSPECQDEAMVALIAGRRALDDVKAGRFEEAIAKCAREWASLPGSPYGQPTLTMEKARARYLERGGYLSAAPIDAPSDPLATEHYGEAVTELTINPVPSADEQEANMAPFLAAAIPAFIQAAPDLIRFFGKGERSEQNAVIAEKVGALAIQVTGAVNEQEAAKVIASNPAKAQEFRAAVADNFDQWMGMMVKFHGLEEESRQKAREAASAQSGDWRKLIFSLPFVAMLLFIPTIWAVVAAAVFKAPWLLALDAQMRGTVIGFVMGTVAGSIVMYVYGASMTKSAPQPSQDR